MVVAWESLWRFLWYCSSFCCYSSFTSSELQPDHFLLPFLFHLQRGLRFWVGIFYPQAFFTSRSFPTFLAAHPNIFGAFPTFWHNLLLSRLQWEPAVTFLKVAGLHNHPWNTDPALSVCLIHSNSQSLHVNSQ